MGKLDLKKSLKELIDILDKKLQDKKVGNNYTKIIQNRSNLSSDLFNEIGSLYNNYYRKYNDFKSKYNTYGDREQASDAAIKFYSNYIALKRIGEVCQEILEQLSQGKEINKKEFIGALKSAELAKEQKKFTLRVATNKLGNDKGEIKLSEILNYSNVLKSVNSNNTETWVNNIQTPFGNIDIKYFIDQGNHRPNVYIYPKDEHGSHFSYTGMAKRIDEYCNKRFDSAKFFKKIAESIKKYIQQKINKSIFDINRIYDLNSIIKVSKPDIVFDMLTAKNAAVLCGCLLFAESCDVRNPTRGKWEKIAIDKVISKIKNSNCTNPFQTVFSGKRALYSPAVSGGMNPSSWLITGKVDITRDFPDNDLLYIFQELNFKNITKNKNYDTFFKDVKKNNLTSVEKLYEDEFNRISSILKSKFSAYTNYTIYNFIEMMSQSEKITEKYLENKLLPQQHPALSGDYLKCFKSAFKKINYCRDINSKNDKLKTIHTIWSSKKLSKNNKIRVADLIQLLKSNNETTLADRLRTTLSDHRTRLADL